MEVMGHGCTRFDMICVIRVHLSQSVLRHSITGGPGYAALSAMGTDRISAEYDAAPNGDLSKPMDEILREEEERELRDRRTNSFFFAIDLPVPNRKQCSSTRESEKMALEFDRLSCFKSVRRNPKDSKKRTPDTMEERFELRIFVESSCLKRFLL